MPEAYWQIGDARLYEASRRFVTSQGTKSLQPQQHRLLLSLLEHQGELVSKEVLLELLWHGKVGDPRLQTLVSDLRRELGEHDAIETVSGSGYLWSARSPRVDLATPLDRAGAGQGTTLVLPEAQRIRWGPVDGRPEGIILIDAPDQPFIPWKELEHEIEQKLLSQLGRLIPDGCKVVLGEFRGRKKWLVRVVSPEGKQLGYVWFGPDPEKEWGFDGLVRVGDAPTDNIAIVWQVFQRYSDGSYRRVKANY